MRSYRIHAILTSACDVFDSLNIAEDIQKNEANRQVAAAFVFGFINAFAFEQKLEPPHVHGVLISILMNKFGYSNKQSIDFAQILIHATSNKNDPTTNAVIHHGVESYYQYRANDIKALRHNYFNVLSKIGE